MNLTHARNSNLRAVQTVADGTSKISIQSDDTDINVLIALRPVYESKKQHRSGQYHSGWLIQRSWLDTGRTMQSSAFQPQIKARVRSQSTAVRKDKYYLSTNTSYLVVRVDLLVVLVHNFHKALPKRQPCNKTNRIKQLRRCLSGPEIQRLRVTSNLARGLELLRHWHICILV
jgi:hypothetical protein